MTELEERPRHYIRKFMLALGFLGIGFVWANALLWQSGLHPAPLFSETGTGPAETTGSLEFLSVSRPQHLAPIPQLRDELDEQFYRDLQTGLKSLGYYSGDVDGIVGPMTRSAILAYQTANGEAATGRPTNRLLQDIRRSAQQASQENGSVPLGSDQQTILSLQRVLADLGYGPGPVNGTLSVTTEDAIRRFEADRGMPQTGQVSDIVLRELSSVSGVQIDPRS
jgi:peptidoglycan hydrolase-like protein with peptidoglycan-binding domain